MIKADHCDNKNWRLDELDSLVEQEVSRLLFDPKYRKALLKQKAEQSAAAPPGEGDVFRGKIADLDKRIGRLMDLYQDEKIPTDVVSARIDKLHREKVALEEQLASVEPPKPKRDYNEDAFAGLLADYATIWKSATPEDKRQVVSALINKITLDGDSVKIEWSFLE